MVYRIFLRGNDRGNVKPSLKGFRINTCAWMGVMAERMGLISNLLYSTQPSPSKLKRAVCRLALHTIEDRTWDLRRSL